LFRMVPFGQAGCRVGPEEVPARLMSQGHVGAVATNRAGPAPMTKPFAGHRYCAERGERV
jgi:hypothetical protein